MAIRHATVYPWDRWLDGHVWELRPGVDFSTLALLSAAAKRATKTKKRGDRRTLEIYTTRRGTVILQYRVKPKKVRLPVPRFGDKRVDQMVEMRERGMTYEEIGKRFKISRQRAQQILTTGQGGMTFVLNPNSQHNRRRYGHTTGEV